MPSPSTHSAHIRDARGDVRTVTPDGWPEGITALKREGDEMARSGADPIVVETLRVDIEGDPENGEMTLRTMRVEPDGSESEIEAKPLIFASQHGDGIELRRHAVIDGDPLDTADDGTRVVHVLRRGPLYDVDSGDFLMDVDDATVAAIVENGNALIAAGQRMPVSREHGIERGQRGADTADTRAYGSIVEFINRGDVYARVRWSELGRGYLAEQRTGVRGAQGEETAVYISPRVMARFAHPDTGENLGRVVDVITLTTGPRQNRMAPVELSRSTEPNQSNNGPESGERGVGMADTQKTPEAGGVEVLLARNGAEAGALCDALNLSRDASPRDIVTAVKAQGEALTRAEAENVELARFKAGVEAQQREADAVTLLSRHGIGKDAPEFDGFKALLSAGGDAAETVRGILSKRGEVDLTRNVEEVFDAAVKRGAYGVGEKADMLARVTPETAAGIIAAIEARPDHAHTGTPSPAPGAGEANAPPAETSVKVTALELSREARDVALKAGADGTDEYLAAYDNHVAAAQAAGRII